MPLLKPSLSEQDTAMAEVLTAAGILSPRRTSERDALKEALRTNGLDLEKCVEELKNQLLDSRKEETRVKLLETALKLNGAMKDDAVREAPSITFQIAGNVNLNAILAPVRE